MDEPDLAPFVAVVDDEEPVRKALGRLLGAMGVRAQGFPDAVSFLASLEGERPDCLVLDLHMPGMSGLDLLAALRERGQLLPTIVITAHDEPETRGRCLRAGAAIYLRKPLDGSALLGAVAEALGERGVIALRRHWPKV